MHCWCHFPGRLHCSLDTATRSTCPPPSTLGLIHLPSYSPDQLSDKFQARPNLPSDLGRDKMATIIQSGRDHGLPTYTQVPHTMLTPKCTYKLKCTVTKLLFSFHFFNPYKRLQIGSNDCKPSLITFHSLQSSAHINNVWAIQPSKHCKPILIKAYTSRPQY